jgi:hypothetical protein
MKRILVVLAVVFVLLLPSGPVMAGAFGDRVIHDGEVVNENVSISGGRLVVEAGGTINGDVFVFGGDAVIDGNINGSLTLYGGNAALSGTVSGDLVLFGGNLELAEGAVVNGECQSVGGNLTGDTGMVRCDVGPALPIPPVPPIPGFQMERERDFEVERGPWSVIGQVSQAIGRSLLLGFLAFVLGAIMPTQLARVGSAISHKPAASGAVGLLTAVAGPSLAALLAFISALLTIVCIGLLGFPIVIFLLVALVAGAIFGWVALGALLGERVAGSLGIKNRSMAVTAAVGTLTLSLLLGLVSLLPPLFGGQIVTILLLCVGLGATALTQFGARPYPPAENEAKVATVLDTLPEEPAN